VLSSATYNIAVALIVMAMKAAVCECGYSITVHHLLIIMFHLLVLQECDLYRAIIKLNYIALPLHNLPHY
jgi:hypothetical protein